MSETSEFRYTGAVVDSEGRTWQVNHDYGLRTEGQELPLTTPVIFMCGKERYTARTPARSALSETEYLALLETRQARRRARDEDGEP